MNRSDEVSREARELGAAMVRYMTAHGANALIVVLEATVTRLRTGKAVVALLRKIGF